jgi:hypothetical protein
MTHTLHPWRLRWPPDLSIGSQIRTGDAVARAVPQAQWTASTSSVEMCKDRRNAAMAFEMNESDGDRLSVTATAGYVPPSPRGGSANRIRHIEAPRPMLTRVTVAGGRSPGSRVDVSVHLPRNEPRSQWYNGWRLSAHSCGGSRGLRARRRAPRSLLIPFGNHRRPALHRSPRRSTMNRWDTRRPCAFSGVCDRAATLPRNDGGSAAVTASSLQR